MQGNTWFRALVVAIALGAFGCGDDDGPANGTPDASTMNDASTMMDGATAGSGGSGGSGGTGVPTAGTSAPPVVMCGGNPCTVSGMAAMLVMPCCADGDVCGGMSPLGTGCIALGQVGSRDDSCPDLEASIMSFPIAYEGCCHESGVCGGRSSIGGLFGCVPVDMLTVADAGTAAGQSCTFNPDETCNTILEATCDGEEDCPTGQECCGRFTGGGYSGFTCEDSCVELAAETGTIISEVCHPGDACDEPIASDAGMSMAPAPTGPFTCKVNTMYLPDWWFRCRDTGTEPTSDQAGSIASGEINCGDTVCGSGQKCCYARDAADTIDTGTAHCVDSDAACTCMPSSEPDGGAEDGGS